MSNMAPGTYVQESTFPTYNSVNTATGTANFVFVGAHSQGPLTPRLVQSWGQFVSLYGGFQAGVIPSFLALAVYSFFNNGGGECYVTRVVHSDAVAAAQMLQDTNGDSVLAVSAVNPGTWGNNISVVVTVNTATNTFNLAVYSGGAQANQLAEPLWTNLSMNPGDSRYAPSLINNPLNGSSFIRLVDEAANPVTAPGQVPAAGTTTLGTGTGSTAGSNGSSVTASDLLATETGLSTLEGPLVVNFPGITDTTDVLAPILNYLTTGRPWADSFLVIDPPPGQTPAAAIAYSSQLPPSSYAGIYYPWVTVSDPASQTPGSLRTIAPGAFAMAEMAVTDSSRGVWKAPAGFFTVLNALAPEVQLLPSDIGNLTAANINCITYKQGAGIVIWGARTLSNQEMAKYINKRRTLQYIEANLLALSNYSTFEDNNYQLWTQLSSRAGTFLSQLWASGAFAGTTANSSYFVTCDDTNNTTSADTVNMSVGVALSNPAEFILIQVGQWAGGSSVSETAA